MQHSSIGGFHVFKIAQMVPNCANHLKLAVAEPFNQSMTTEESLAIFAIPGTNN